MQLLADSTGQTPNVGTIVPQPWRFEYAYPTDCMKARFVPWNQVPQSAGIPPSNIQIPSTPPLTTGQTAMPPITRIQPARFIEATDYNYPPQPGQITWEVQGVSPQGRTVILTNVQNATLVYTALMLYPSVWDPLFRAAMVAYLASEIALPLAKDKKFGLQVRTSNIEIVKAKVKQARETDGNEGVPSSNLSVDWMRNRTAGASGFWGPYGAGAWGGGGDCGNYYGAVNALALADGSVF